MTVLRRVSGLLGIVLFLGSGFLLGRELLAPVFEDDQPATAFTQDPCTGCPVALTSAEVQARSGSTLFAFEGGWPGSVGEVPGDLRLEASDFEVVLRPNADADAFEITDGSSAASRDTVAVGIVDGSLLVNLADDLVTAPVEFVFGLWDGKEFTARIPRSGSLSWDGTGAPRPLTEEAAAEDPVEQPPEEPAEETPGAETPEEFLDDLASALREGDQVFLFERLHPAVLDVYGEDQCRSHARTLQDPQTGFDVVRVSELEPYDYDPDDLTVTIPEAYTVTADITGTQGTNRGQVHVAPVDGQITWFTDCGDPV